MIQPEEKPTGSRWSAKKIGIVVGVLTVGTFLLCAGIIIPFDFLFNLILGWIFFLLKVIPQITVSLPGIITFIVVLGLFTAGVHFTGRHVYRLRASINETTPSQNWQWKRTTQVVFSIVLLFASGIAIVGVAHQGIWLVTSKEDWTIYRSGGGSRRSACKNNMKQIGLAFHNYHDVHRTFPPGGTFNETGRPHHSWATAMLPFLDQAPLYNQIDFSHPWDAPENTKPFQTILPAIVCPNFIHSEKNSKGQAITTYAGNSRVFSVNSRTRISDFTDGTSHTILAGGVNSRFKPWGDPVNLRDPALGINQHRNGFGSQHTGGTHVVFADGRVRFLSENIDPKILKSLSTPNSGDVIGEY